MVHRLGERNLPQLGLGGAGMKDAYGVEIRKGDLVVYVVGVSFSRLHHLRYGEVIEVTPTSIQVEPRDDSYEIQKYRARYAWEDPDSEDFAPDLANTEKSNLVKTSARVYILEDGR